MEQPKQIGPENCGIFGITPIEVLSNLNELIEQNNETEGHNNFPFEVFPSPFNQLIIECNEALNFPTDYTGSTILSAVSTAIGKSAKLKVKNAWFEFPCIYLSIVGNAGINKSHALELVFKPFQEIDRIEIQKYKIAYNEYVNLLELPKKERANLPKPVIPKLIKTVLHNFTSEKLYRLLEDNMRGCAIVSDELATFLEGMNNYSKSDQTSVYLSIWSNKATSIDRVKDPIPMFIPQPFLNIIGSFQPRVLPKLFPTEKSDNGLLQRFLFAFPNDVEKHPINDIEINESLIQDYHDWINKYRSANPITIDSDTTLAKSRIYHWSPEAKIFYYNWHKQHTNQVNENADSLKGEILSKFDIHFVRLSLVLQIMYDYQTDLISLNAVKGAEKLCNYFQNNAMKVMNILQSSDPVIMFPQNKQNLYNAFPDKFTTAEAIIIGSRVPNKNGKCFDEKAIDRFIKNKNLFDWLAQGQYRKKSKR